MLHEASTAPGCSSGNCGTRTQTDVLRLLDKNCGQHAILTWGNTHGRESTLSPINGRQDSAIDRRFCLEWTRSMHPYWAGTYIALSLAERAAFITQLTVASCEEEAEDESEGTVPISLIHTNLFHGTLMFGIA